LITPFSVQEPSLHQLLESIIKGPVHFGFTVKEEDRKVEDPVRHDLADRLEIGRMEYNRFPPMGTD
jgi:hypothetical protein